MSHVDRATGQPIRRYERATPGELVHVDIKKLGNIPDGGGHKVHGRQAGLRNSSAHRDPARPRKRGGRSNLGYSYLHNAVDDHSRLAYSEILADETKQTAVAFWQRAQTFFHANGITVERVLTDNGACYRSLLWRDTLTAAGITHKRTRPYRPQTNGKVERFNRTLLDEWATPVSTALRPNAARRSRGGFTPTITTAVTPRSKADRPPAAFRTSPGSTASSRSSCTTTRVRS